jgi:hypothetical protein
LSQLERAMRGTPVSRVHAALARARCGERKERGQCACGNRERWEAATRDGSSLLPCHFLQLPEWFVRPEVTGRGPGSQARLRRRKLAWRLAEWQVAVFTSSELGWPKDAAAAVAKLGPTVLSGVQTGV